MRRSHQVTANVEKVADESMHGQESLRLTGRFKPSHLSLTLPCGLVGDFGAIVPVSVRAMGDGRHDRSVRSPVAAQLVGDQPPRLTLLALQQLAKKACGSPAVAPRLDEDVDDVAILIDGTPEIVAPSLDGVVARIVNGPHEANRQNPHLPMRYDTGRPSSVIRLRISQPRTTSLPCPAGLRARRPSPMMDL